ncbi:hypothetical protein AVEN_205351-1, partial [Araneus ventricosus]
YVNSDRQIMTSKLFTIDELVEEKLAGANLKDDEAISPFFKGAMDSTEKFRTYFFGQKNSENESMNLIHNYELNTH